MQVFRIAAIALVTTALTVPAFPQAGRGLEKREDPKIDTEKKKAEDKAYGEALSRIPADKQFDPWAGARETKPTPPPKKPQR